MSFGAYLTTADGGVFVTPESMPLSLIEKRTLAVGATEVSVSYDSSRPIIPFITHNRAAPVDNSASTAITATLSNGVCKLSCYLMGVTGGTMDVYFFSVKPQIPPAWGMAIWDANGVCILTNETKVLTDVEAIRNPADENNSGTTLDITKAGRWAVMPRMVGYYVGVIGGSQPIPFQSIQTSMAYYSGGNTRIKAVSGATPGGGMQNPGYINYRNRYLITDVSRY